MARITNHGPQQRAMLPNPEESEPSSLVRDDNEKIQHRIKNLHTRQK